MGVYLYTNGPTTYRYIKWTIEHARDDSDGRFQASEFEICDGNGTKMARPTGTTISANYTGNTGETIDKLIDGSVDTKYCAQVSSFPVIITITLGSAVSFSTYNKYKWYTANDSISRDAKTWTIQLSDDGVNWITVSTVTDADITTTRKTLAGTWNMCEHELKNAYIGEYQPYTPGANTLAYFPLKEDVLDHSGNGNNGSGNPNSFAGGVANYSGNATTMPVVLVSSGTITVNVWFYQEAGAADFNKNISFLGQHTTQNFGFCLKSNEYYDSLYHLSLFQSGGSGYATTYAVTITSSTPRIGWHNMVGMRDASKIYLYLDGQYQGETAYSGLSSNAFYMGYDYGYNGGAWNGKLSQLIFENRIRTATEILNYYNKTKSDYGL